MYIIRKEFRFEAAHQLPDHDGKCSRLHGHSWRGEAVFEGNDLYTAGPKAGMLIDYGTISELVKPIVDTYLDHYFLNDSLGLSNPTSETIAKWVFGELESKYNQYVDDLHEREVKSTGAYKIAPTLAAVIIHETCTSSCEYRPLQIELCNDELRELHS